MTPSRRAKGQVAHLSGIAAEQGIARDYERRGLEIARRRWRGAAGEIDLITRDGDEVVFVEVKKARNFDRAAESLRPRQMQRLYQSAQEFLAGEPRGQLTPARFDVALVDGMGNHRILENVMFAA